MTAPALLTDHPGPIPDAAIHVELGYYPEGAQVSRWDVAQWDVADGGQWVGPAPLDDISCDVMSVKISQGRDLPMERFRPGSCVVELYDPDGKYSPWRTAPETGTFATVRPGIDLVVWADVDGGRHDRFAGIVDAITDSFPVPAIPDRHVVEFQAFDYSSLLAAWDGVEQNPVGAGELAGARLNRIADNAAYSYPRAFDSGTVALQATTLAKNAWDEMGLVSDTEMGALWCNRSGVLVFRDRNGLVSDPAYTTVQAVFGDRDPEICYSDLDLVNDLEQLRNVVSVANEGGTMVTVTDTQSVGLYRPRTYRRTDLINQDGAQNAVVAQRHLDFFAFAAQRIEGLEVDLAVVDPALLPVVLNLDVLDRVEVRRRAVGFQVVAQLQVQGFTETISPQRWEFSYRTFNAAAVFDVGRWDSDRWDTGLWGF